MLPPAVGIPRAFNSRAMALPETKPAVRTSRIVERKASARMSATRFNARLLLVPPCFDVSWRRRVSSLLMELRCHRPPRAPVIPLRFNSFVRPPSEAKPAAISSRMVGSKASARASAACLAANAPCLLANALGPKFSRVPLAHHGRNKGVNNVWGLGLASMSAASSTSAQHPRQG